MPSFPHTRRLRGQSLTSLASVRTSSGRDIPRRQRVSFACAKTLAVGVVVFGLHGGNAAGQIPPVDSLVASVRSVLAECDSQIAELTFVSMLQERELRDDGSIKKEKTLKSRHFIRGKASREVLEAMWENGQLVSASRLQDEREEREKERSKQEKAASEGGSANSRSASVMEPFRSSHTVDYSFPSVIADTLGELACWKINVAPTRDDKVLVRGNVWIEQGTSRAIREEYDMANRPGPVKDFGISMDHISILGPCAFPSVFRLHVRGKALLLFKFNVDVELRLDSVQVNPNLPDSLFATPAD